MRADRVGYRTDEEVWAVGGSGSLFRSADGASRGSASGRPTTCRATSTTSSSWGRGRGSSWAATASSCGTSAPERAGREDGRWIVAQYQIAFAPDGSQLN